MASIESMKKKPNTLQNTLPIPEGLRDFRVVEWIDQYGWYVLMGAIALFTFLFLLYSTGKNTKAESDYLNAERSMLVMQTTTESTEREEAFRQLRHILKRRPELHAKYDASLAQILMAQGLTTEAQVYAKRTLSRLSQDALPTMQNFATTTLMINEGNQSEALSQAQVLKEQLLAQIPLRDGNETLFAFNQLRIAMLHHAFGDVVQEQLAWEEWNDYTAGNFDHLPQSDIDSLPFQQMNAAMTEGAVSLDNFIQTRLAKQTG